MLRATVDGLRRHKGIVLLVVAIGLYYPRFVRRPDGVVLYPRGAECLLRGEVLEQGAPGFTYPPAFAFSMIPFVFLPLWLRNPVWYAVLVGATYLSFRLCEILTLEGQTEPLKGRERVWLRILTWVLSIKFVLAVFENQAYDVLVFLCVLFGLYGMVRRKDLCAATGLALAAALKVTPLLFFPYLLLRRRLKLFLLCVVSYAVFSFLPDLFFTPQGAPSGYFVTWARDIAGGAFVKTTAEHQPARQWQMVNPLNQSLRSLVYQFTDGRDPASRSQAILYGVYLGYVLVVSILLLKSSKREDAAVLDGSLLLISMLMLSPMSSKSHLVVLMLPYMVLSAHLIREQRIRWIGGGLLAVSFALNTLTSRDLIGSRLSTLCLSAGCITLGTLVLLIPIGYLILTRRPSSRT